MQEINMEEIMKKRTFTRIALIGTEENNNKSEQVIRQVIPNIDDVEIVKFNSFEEFNNYTNNGSYQKLSKFDIITPNLESPIGINELFYKKDMPKQKKKFNLKDIITNTSVLRFLMFITGLICFTILVLNGYWGYGAGWIIFLLFFMYA